MGSVSVVFYCFFYYNRITITWTGNNDSFDRISLPATIPLDDDDDRQRWRRTYRRPEPSGVWFPDRALIGYWTMIFVYVRMRGFKKSAGGWRRGWVRKMIWSRKSPPVRPKRARAVRTRRPSSPVVLTTPEGSARASVGVHKGRPPSDAIARCVDAYRIAARNESFCAAVFTMRITHGCSTCSQAAPLLIDHTRTNAWCCRFGFDWNRPAAVADSKGCTTTRHLRDPEHVDRNESAKPVSASKYYDWNAAAISRNRKEIAHDMLYLPRLL